MVLHEIKNVIFSLKHCIVCMCWLLGCVWSSVLKLLHMNWGGCLQLSVRTNGSKLALDKGFMMPWQQEAVNDSLHSCIYDHTCLPPTRPEGTVYRVSAVEAVVPWLNLKRRVKLLGYYVKHQSNTQTCTLCFAHFKRLLWHHFVLLLHFLTWL